MNDNPRKDPNKNPRDPGVIDPRNDPTKNPHQPDIKPENDPRQNPQRPFNPEVEP